MTSIFTNLLSSLEFLWNTFGFIHFQKPSAYSIVFRGNKIHRLVDSNIILKIPLFETVGYLSKGIKLINPKNIQFLIKGFLPKVIIYDIYIHYEILDPIKFLTDYFITLDSNDSTINHIYVQNIILSSIRSQMINRLENKIKLTDPYIVDSCFKIHKIDIVSKMEALTINNISQQDSNALW